MNWLVKTLTTSVGQKVLMAVTGLALCGFLVVHLGGNLLLYVGAEEFDAYAKAIHDQAEHGLLLIAEASLVGLFGLHIFLAVSTNVRNRKARGTGYAVKTPKKRSGWLIFDPSYMMTLTGIVIFLFLCLHLSDLRLGKFDEDSGENSRLVLTELVKKENQATYDQVKNVLSDPFSGPVYLIGAVLLAVHVSHGFSSAFQSLGFDHPKYTSLVQCVSVLFALVVGFGFASFPIWAMLTQQ